MANMSYCRFQNTLSDFNDCLYAIQEIQEKESTIEEELSPEEESSRISL